MNERICIEFDGSKNEILFHLGTEVVIVPGFLTDSTGKCFAKTISIDDQKRILRLLVKNLGGES
jgi:hypothetical protein